MSHRFSRPPSGGREPITGSAELVPTEALSTGISPRLSGVDERHASLLAESSGSFPPIIVQKQSMRIIDGMHRLRATQLREQSEILVTFVQVDDEVAFLRAVEANITHGLPLNLVDRKAAAMHIIEIRPEWSDRAVARAAGISAKTVAVLRRRNEAATQVAARRGRDGKLRPVNAAAGRELARDLLNSRPQATLREIARAAGVSPSTVSEVRDRLRRGDDPISPRRSPPDTAAQQSTTQPALHRVMTSLLRDPSLRYTEAGRTILALLKAQFTLVDEADIVRALPSHCLVRIAKLSRQNALQWQHLAELAEHHAEGGTNSRGKHNLAT